VENELHTMSIGQSTHQDLVENSGLRRILFDEICLWRICFLKNICIFHKNLLHNDFGNPSMIKCISGIHLI